MEKNFGGVHSNIIVRILLTMIRLYQYCISGILGPCCRFYPSCSEYTRVAMIKHGVVCGGWMSLKRILRCHPWHEGGVDEVPMKKVRFAKIRLKLTNV